uniref:SJCHGC09747 protein n=1 Tax=Schistosoma japonicum TaxID=6182 RepID=Q5BQZ6_SCHJA|nr:SJCHGC09747 protein [Schistosoma japonicum]
MNKYTSKMTNETGYFGHEIREFIHIISYYHHKKAYFGSVPVDTNAVMREKTCKITFKELKQNKFKRCRTLINFTLGKNGDKTDSTIYDRNNSRFV